MKFEAYENYLIVLKANNKITPIMIKLPEKKFDFR